MAEEIKKTEEVKTEAPKSAPRPAAGGFSRAPASRSGMGGSGGAGGQRRHGGGRGGPREARVKPEFDSKILDIRRVTRVVAGGKRFNFSVAIVCGNRKGSVGVGLGKAIDTALAIDKATRSAKKHMIRLNLTKTSSIPHQLEAKYGSALVMLKPAPGRGIVAGSAVRTIIDLAGVRDVVSKIFSGSKNKLNMARATIEALSEIKAKGNNVVVPIAPASNAQVPTSPVKSA